MVPTATTTTTTTTTITTFMARIAITATNLCVIR